MLGARELIRELVEIRMDWVCSRGLPPSPSAFYFSANYAAPRKMVACRVRTSELY